MAQAGANVDAKGQLAGRSAMRWRMKVELERPDLTVV